MPLQIYITRLLDETSDLNLLNYAEYITHRTFATLGSDAREVYVLQKAIAILCRKLPSRGEASLLGRRICEHDAIGPYVNRHGYHANYSRSCYGVGKLMERDHSEQVGKRWQDFAGTGTALHCWWAGDTWRGEWIQADSLEELLEHLAPVQ